MVSLGGGGGSGESFVLWPQAQSSVVCESLVFSLAPGADFGPGLQICFLCTETLLWSQDTGVERPLSPPSSLPAGLSTPHLQPPLFLNPRTNPASTFCSAFCCQSNKPFLGLGC